MSITAQYIVIGLIFAAIIAWKVRKRILRKKGKAPKSGCGCGCGCSGCSACAPAGKACEDEKCKADGNPAEK